MGDYCEITEFFCGQVSIQSGGEYSCEIELGWYTFIIAFILIAIYSVYKLNLQISEKSALDGGEQQIHLGTIGTSPDHRTASQCSHLAPRQACLVELLKTPIFDPHLEKGATHSHSSRVSSVWMG